jgi:hypothetical protein
MYVPSQLVSLLDFCGKKHDFSAEGQWVHWLSYQVTTGVTMGLAENRAPLSLMVEHHSDHCSNQNTFRIILRVYCRYTGVPHFSHIWICSTNDNNFATKIAFVQIPEVTPAIHRVQHKYQEFHDPWIPWERTSGRKETFLWWYLFPSGVLRALLLFSVMPVFSRACPGRLSKGGPH